MPWPISWSAASSHYRVEQLLDFSTMEEYIATLLQAQLEDDGLPYEGASSI